VRDQSRTLQELIDENSNRVRERIVLRRFERFKVGEDA
jgi:hypothetical protein